MWHMTRDMWHLTFDKWQVDGVEHSLKIPLAHTVWEWRCFEDFEEKDQSPNELITKVLVQQPRLHRISQTCDFGQWWTSTKSLSLPLSVQGSPLPVIPVECWSAIGQEEKILDFFWLMTKKSALFTKPLLFKKNRLTCSGNPSFESCVEGKAQLREIAVYSQSSFQRSQH